MATAEAIFAMIESSQQRREVLLSHQVPLDREYDSDLQLVRG